MMHIIDFSDGIRSEEIQDNFELLDAQIKRTRLSVGGSGIASGLNVTPIVNDNQFAIRVSSASVIDKNGNEVFIEEQVVDVERPKLSKQKEYLTADINNQIRLKEVPYMLDRKCPVQYGDSLASLYSGITVSYQNSLSSDDYIRVKSVNGRTLTLTGLTRRDVVVEYYSTAKRIDTVYVNTDNKICVETSSITSTTPSAIIPEKYNYLIAFILIDSACVEDADDDPHADIKLKKDLRKIRSIYTSEDGILYLNGIPFTDLHLIVTVEPENPYPNQLWLDNGVLYVWQAVDEYTYKRNIEINSSYDFTGYHDFETNIDFLVNGNQLKVYRNSEQLQDAEYDELFAGLPSSIQDIPENTYSNMFRIYSNFVVGDVITYTITFNESGYRWVPVNKESYVRTKEHKAYGYIDKDNNYWASAPEALCRNDENGWPYKYSYFIFDADFDRRMLFTPNNNEVDVMVNQLPLHKDQYSEITLDMIDVLPDEVQYAIRNDFHWDDETIHRINELYDNIGIGIMINEPTLYAYTTLYEGEYSNTTGEDVQETELYVEIIANRACSSFNKKRKLQRNATYVFEDTFTVSNTFNTTIDLEDVSYRYNENQLEVYINGMRMQKGVDFDEGTDLDDDLLDESIMLRARGAVSRQFKIKKPIHIGDVVTYKITTSFYSYDHINSLIDKLETDQEACNAKVETLYNSTMKLHDDTNTVIQDMQDQLNMYSNTNNNALDSYLTRSSVIAEDQLAEDLVMRIPQSRDHVCHVHTFTTYSEELGIEVTDYLREEDFELIWWRDVTNDIDRLLLPDVDYTIGEANNSTTTVVLKLSEEFQEKIKTDDKLIIRAIKFGRAGR